MNRHLLARLSSGPYADFIQQFRDSRYEFIGIVLHATLDRDKSIGHKMLASGHQGRVRFDLRDILEAVKDVSAVAVTMIHNHPFSNRFEPSLEDVRVTERVDQALREIGAEVIDHRIYVSNGTCLSFVDQKVGRWGWEKVEFSPDDSQTLKATQ